MDIGSILSGVGAVGGLFGSKPKVISAADNIISLARGVRTASAETGINMAALLGASPVSSVIPGTEMGSRVADAAMALGDLVGASKPAQKLAQLEATVEAQAKKLNDYQLRPKQPGVYARRAAVPTVAPSAPGKQVIPTGAHADPELVQGPRHAVKVFNTSANKWNWVDGGVAKRLELKTGDTMLAEDFEAIHGDVGSEFINTPNVANEILGYGVTYPAKPDVSKNPKFISDEEKRHKKIVDDLNAARNSWGQ